MLAAAVISAVAALAMTPLARRFGWMDVPDARKLHSMPTPLVGGPAIFIACLAVMWFAGLPCNLALLGAAGLMLLSGGVDDRWPLSAITRFAMQIVACLVMIYAGDVMLTDFGRLFWDRVLVLGPVAVPITVFAALGVINAFNMMDGLDGLSGNVFLVSALSLAWLAARAGQAVAASLLLIACGAVAGFLILNARTPWNPRARVFLGDSGSLLLGFFLAWMFIDLGNGPVESGGRAFAPMTAVWIFGIPLLDTTHLIYHRRRAGGSAFAADQEHLHHAFLRAGLSTAKTCWAVTGLCVLFALIGIALEVAQVPEYLRFYGFIALGLVYITVIPVSRREDRDPPEG
jgi:UDP-GlcNAc:undecaprenyl-phosphate GlcNAc-1-phosphate transferase